jgi:archaellum component FlaF (FlaF/FlaG flagellin family)
MRMLVAFLVVLGVVYVWDVNYNNGVVTAGVTGMLRDISHSFRN